MFSDVGKKIKGVAVASFVLEAIAGIVVFMCFLIDGYEFWECLIPLGSILVSLIIAWFIYGFGELVDNSVSVTEDTRVIREKLNKSSEQSKKSEDKPFAGNNKPASAPKNSNSTQKKAFQNASTANAGSWACTCGKVNPKYMSSCTCGVSRKEIMAKNTKTEKKDQKPMITPNGRLVCHVCNYVQQSNVRKCGNCGIEFDI